MHFCGWCHFWLRCFLRQNRRCWYLQCLTDCFGAGWPGPVSLLYRLRLVMRPRHRHRPRRGLRRLSGIFPAAAQIFLYAVWSDLTKKTRDTPLCYLCIGVGLRQWFTQRIIGADDATHARYIYTRYLLYLHSTADARYTGDTMPDVTRVMSL